MTNPKQTVEYLLTDASPSKSPAYLCGEGKAPRDSWKGDQVSEKHMPCPSQLSSAWARERAVRRRRRRRSFLPEAAKALGALPALPPTAALT